MASPPRRNHAHGHAVTRTSHRHARRFGIVVAAACMSLALAPARAQVTAAQLDDAAKLFSDGNYAAAAEAGEKLINSLGPEQQHLRAALQYNRACALLAATQPEKAAEVFLATDTAAAEPALRAGARYNLGQIAARQGDALAEKEADQAIEAYRRAERFFRNSLVDQSSPDDRTSTARNIEAVQRRIAKLLEQQKKEQQQQQQQQDQQKKDEKDQKDQKNQDSKGDPKDQQNKDKQNKEQQGKDGKNQQSSPPESRPEENKDSQPGDENEKKQDNNANEQKQGVEDQKKAAGADQDAKPVKIKPGDKHEFDRAAAEILDKEKKQRERIRAMIRKLQRSAPVERDW